MGTIQILPSVSYKKMPWKNGGGLTHEILRFPESSENFDFRISMAEVSQPGDFSFFKDYQRILSILKGEGISLLIEKKETKILKKQEIFTFSGGLQIYSELLQGPVLDFNLIYKPEKYQARCQWLYTPEDSFTIITSAPHIFLFNSGKNICKITVNQQTKELSALDTLEIHSEKPETHEISLYPPNTILMAELYEHNN